MHFTQKVISDLFKKNPDLKRVVINLDLSRISQEAKEAISDSSEFDHKLNGTIEPTPFVPSKTSGIASKKQPKQGLSPNDYTREPEKSSIGQKTELSENTESTDSLMSETDSTKQQDLTSYEAWVKHQEKYL